MKTKITLILVLFFIIFKIQAQMPSINETKSELFIDSPSFQTKYNKILQKRVVKLEDQKKEFRKQIDGKSVVEDSIVIKGKESEVESIKTDIKYLKTDKMYKVFKVYYKGIIDRKRDSINAYYEVLKTDDYKYNLAAIDSINKLIDAKKQELRLTIIERDKKLDSLDKKYLKTDRAYEVFKVYYEEKLTRKVDSISEYYEVLKEDKYRYDIKAIDSIKKLIDAKKNELQLAIIERDEKLASLDKFDWYLPSWKKENREKFFYDMYSNKTDKTIYLNSFALTSNSDATAVQTEIVTDNMSALRISLGSVLSVSSNKETEETSGETSRTTEEQPKKETEEEAFSRLINGGGNFYLDLILPLLTTNQNNGYQITFYGYANLRGAMDLKDFSKNVDTSTGNGTLGLNAYLGLSSDSKKFNFFFQGNMNYTVGTNDFYKNLGLNNEKPFLNGKIIAGVTILNNFRFSAIINAFGSDEKIRSNKVVVGIQILPGL